MQVIAIAIGKYQRVKGGVKCKERMCRFVLGLVLHTNHLEIQSFIEVFLNEFSAMNRV